MNEGRYEKIQSLFRLEATSLYNYVSHMCPSGVDAQDVVQEVFIKAFRYWDTFKHQSSEKTWLFKIARNHVFDMCRKEKREMNSLYSLEAISQKSATLASSLELREIISSLPLIQRETLYLRVIQGLSTVETAGVLGVSPMNVRVSLHRARKQVTKQWFANTVDERGEVREEFSHR